MGIWPLLRTWLSQPFCYHCLLSYIFERFSSPDNWRLGFSEEGFQNTWWNIQVISSARPEIWAGVVELGSWWGLSIEVRVDVYISSFVQIGPMIFVETVVCFLFFCLFLDLACFYWMSLSACQHSYELSIWCILNLFFFGSLKIVQTGASLSSTLFFQTISSQSLKLITPIGTNTAATLQSRRIVKIFPCQRSSTGEMSVQSVYYYIQFYFPSLSLSGKNFI